MDSGIEQAILTNEELLQATAAILNQQLSSSTSPEPDIHSIRFCSGFLSPNHEAHYPDNPFQLDFTTLQCPTHPDEPIDPRLTEGNLAINESIFHHDSLLEPIPPVPQSNHASQIIAKPKKSSKRRKTNLKKSQNVRIHAFDIPTCPFEQADICPQQSISVNEINIPLNDSEQSNSRINGSQDSSLSSTSIFSQLQSREDELTHDHSMYQAHHQRKSSSASVTPHTRCSVGQISEAAQVESTFLYDPSHSSFAEPNIHPSLQAIQPNLSAFPLGSTSFRSHSQTNAHHTQTIPKTAEPKKQTLESPKLSAFPTLYRPDSQVDVHGAGAGGGAATVLAAAAAQQVGPTAATGLQQDTSGATQADDAREDGIGERGLDVDSEPLPTSYNPDQFRSCNRIHWTKEEEELLMAEVELNWERYDCMAHIMKRHGPRGSVSRAFGDRTGVSLKDKAVNISSKWYRDGTDVSAARRRAFARFRPKQLRGKPRNELPGMASLPDSSLPDAHHLHQQSSASSQ
ncbi:hypothetical protein PTTG_27346 [Puccinia triticina 1-1 BBBD Race 1]|uniref:Uncharacterized protein n=2 Tax=Puccinia triticina TaxID=208348 RepID=A0A180GLD5_PUCT1|nr:uncharacterized protein PtA15_6A200 [Puccinia triticina]OAV93435.1 hypothetical protein PTTG_27346 [Puccinia triticina 1-1 BBBD Race 1]WAQ85572.1 hypothetical protein PtA15_6A200 [Puccinia triticina]WAR55454.1 hypothetical protein PtB15_6B195 [Puccinia triticina]